MAKSKSYKKKLPKYAPGGNTNDPRRRMAEEAARRKGVVALPDISFTRPSNQEIGYIKEQEKKAKIANKEADIARVMKNPAIKNRKQAEEFLRMKAKETYRGSDQLRQTPEAQSTLGKIVDVVSHPGLALDVYRTSGTLPDYFADKPIEGVTGLMDIPYSFTGLGAVTGIAESAKNVPGLLGEGNYLASGLEAGSFVPGLRNIKGLSKKAGKKLKSMYELNPRAWGKTATERLEDPSLLQAAHNLEEIPWSDPIGKLKSKKITKEMKKMQTDYADLLKTNPALLDEIEAAKRSALNIQRSGVPIKPIMTESGTPLGGGQGRLYVNTLNPEEVIKMGAYPGSTENIQQLIETGKKLNMPNVAFPKKFVDFGERSSGNIYGAQFMPWLGETPLDVTNPVAKRLQSARAGSKEDLINLAKKLDESNVGIDYYGSQNIGYNPKTNQNVVFDVNYINRQNPEEMNLLDIPVEQRLLQKKYITPKQYGGYMAGKLNRRKGLPSRFPMYDGISGSSTVGYNNPDDRRVNRLSQTLLSDWDYNTQYDPYKSKTQPALGSNTDITVNNKLSNTKKPKKEDPDKPKTDWVGIAGTALGTLGALTERPQGNMSEVYGSTGYLDAIKKANEQGTALKSGVSSVFSAIPGWGQIAAVGIQANDLLTNAIAPVDEYGMAESETQQWIRNILDPTAAVMGAFQGVNTFDYDKMASQKSGLIANYGRKKTGEAQDAYAQAVKAQEGKYLELGGYMPRYANGGRMVNPYNGMPNAEIEGEVVNHADGGIQDFSHLPNHESATPANEVNLKEGTFIFSKRIKNPITGRPFATDAKRYNTSNEEKIFNNKQATPITSKSAKLTFGVKKQLADKLAELHEATKLHNGAQKAENEATEEFIGMLGGMYGKGGLIKRKDGSYSPRGLWDNIRANKGSGKKPTKAMLEQEKKIKAQEKAYGGYMNMYEAGGYALGESYDLSDAELKELKRQGYKFDIE